MAEEYEEAASGIYLPPTLVGFFPTSARFSDHLQIPYPRHSPRLLGYKTYRPIPNALRTSPLIYKFHYPFKKATANQLDFP